MPLPLNHNTNRFSIGALVSAYAVPMELNIVTSGGNPTVIAEPETVSPRRNRRRDKRQRLVITCDTDTPLFARKFARANQRNHELPEIKVCGFEILVNAVDHWAIGLCLHPARSI